MKQTILTDKFVIAGTLEALGIREINKGASTGAQWLDTSGETLESYSSSDGSLIAKITQAKEEDYEHIIRTAQKAFAEWRKVPAPKRGEIVRQIGDELRKYK